jgi:serine/threonine-protein kinase
MRELAGRYRVEKTIGKGGMGVVLAALDLETRERVAVKLMNEAWLGDENLVARFFREAVAAAKVDSVHVAQVIAHGTLEDGRPYIVSELLDGFDLARYMTGGHLPVAEVVDLVRQACRGLEAVHRAGIIHRDLKPANLYFAHDASGRGLIKILDFGICKLRDRARGNSLTRESEIMGTPRYMSPEQLASARDVDARTDIWAMGVILYEILAGRPPFPGNHITELTRAILGDAPAGLQSLRPDVPAGLVNVVERCLAKQRGDRYASAAELDRALAPFGGEDLETKPRADERRPPTIKLDDPPPSKRASGEVPPTKPSALEPNPIPPAAPAPSSSQKNLVVRAMGFKRFGRYLVYRPLASGGMASVFYGVARADDGSLSSVAIKQVRSDVASPERVTMLADEARITGNIRHPNVVGILDVIVEAGTVMLAMPLVIGVSLQQLRQAAEARNRPIPSPIATAIIRDVLAGIHAAHVAKDQFGQPLEIIHRDISPHNILVDIRGQALVTDFGVAFARGRLQRSTETGPLKGKVGYLAPEQIHGKPTTATDLYAAGAVYWELLTGQPLFDGSDAEMLAAALLGRIDAPSARTASLPSELDAVVLRSLAREPIDRYQDAAAMEAAIGAVLPAASHDEVAAWLREVCAPELKEQQSVVDDMMRAVVRQNPFDDASFGTDDTHYSSEVPVAAASALPATAAPRARRWAVPAAFTALLMVGGGAYGLGARRSVAIPAAPSASVAATAATASVTSAASSEPAAAASDGEPLVELEEPHVDGAKHGKPRPGVRAPKKPDCTTPYTIDSAGHTVWRRECFKK